MLKRTMAILVVACLLSSAIAIAETQKTIPARFDSVLEVCNATNIKEMHQNLIDYINDVLRPEENGHYTTKNTPLTIRFGGTTQELVQEQKRWMMAVVSSKEVDIQALADKGLIKNWILIPVNEPAPSNWLLPQNLRGLLPTDITKLYDLYVFDYDPHTDDATLLIMNNQKEEAWTFPQILMNMRSAEQKRAMEGICRVKYWTEEELIARPEEWDISTVRVKLPGGLERLDQAGLLLDLSQNDYLAARQTKEDDRKGHGIMPNGIFSADGRMIGIPAWPAEPGVEDQFEVLVINAKSAYIEDSLVYALHYFEACDWTFSSANTWKPISKELAEQFWKR